MDIIVNFYGAEGSGVKHDWMNIAIHLGQEDGRQGMVQCVCFDNHWRFRVPVYEDGSHGKHSLQGIEGCLATCGPQPGFVLSY